MRLSTQKSLLKLVGMVLALMILPLILWHIPIVQYGLLHSQQWCRKPWAWLWFLNVSILYCALGLPRQAVGLVAGASFGPEVGILLCSIAYEIGSLISYAGGRFLGRRWAVDLLKSVTEFMQLSPFKGVLCLRLMPVGSSLLIAIVAGGLRLPVFSFALATALGGWPQNMIFVCAGSGLHIGHQQELVFAIMLFLASVGLGLLMLRRYRAAAEWSHTTAGGE